MRLPRFARNDIKANYSFKKNPAYTKRDFFINSIELLPMYSFALAVFAYNISFIN